MTRADLPEIGAEVWHRPFDSDAWGRVTVFAHCDNGDALDLITLEGVTRYALHGVGPGCWATADELIAWIRVRRSAVIRAAWARRLLEDEAPT